MDVVRERLAHAFDCPLYSALAVLGGRWKPLILWLLIEAGPQRFLGLQRQLHGVPKKVLSQQLKELIASGLVSRTVLASKPPHTEYRITPYGLTVRPRARRAVLLGRNTQRLKTGRGSRRRGISNPPSLNTSGFWRSTGFRPGARMDFDALPLLARVRCPVLAQAGGSDPKNDGAGALKRIEAALAAGGNTAFTGLVYPDAGHGLVEWRLPFGLPPPWLAPGSLDAEPDWVEQHAGTR